MARFFCVCLGFGLLRLASACSSTSELSPPSAPNALRVSVPELYSLDESPPGGGIDEICKIDPAACPVLDVAHERARAKNRGPEILLTGPLAGAPTVGKRRTGVVPALRSLFRGPRTTLAAPPTPTPTAQPARVELFDIEAWLSLEVASIAQGRARVVQLTRESGGQVVNEVVEDQLHTRGASLSLRIPSERVHAFLAAVATIGRVRSQKVETKEVGRKLADAEVLLKNLRQALARYQELLGKAANVAEATEIEGELDRVRTMIDRVEGDIEWMRDRVARSTVYVTLAMPATELPVDPKVKLHPGLRAVLLFDVPPEASGTSYGGGGLSLSLSRAFSIDMDLLANLEDSDGTAVDFFIASAGGELHSDFLGAGRRRWLNPYFGFRAGYARARGENQLALGGTLGVELYKSKVVLLDVQGRVYALIGPEDGVHLGLQPTLGFNVAY